MLLWRPRETAVACPRGKYASPSPFRQRRCYSTLWEPCLRRPHGIDHAIGHDSLPGSVEELVARHFDGHLRWFPERFGMRSPAVATTLRVLSRASKQRSCTGHPPSQRYWEAGRPPAFVNRFRFRQQDVGLARVAVAGDRSVSFLVLPGFPGAPDRVAGLRL
jgi:hypothetical protein